MTRFHQAARDGYLDLLKEANRKECNLPDEDGVTPTLLAAACGNLDVLRLLVGRGGDPDKCDYYGNSALHWAAGNGHINCVSFLINFGVNLWTLDNTHLTAKDLAGIKGQKDILRFLDIEAAKQSSNNKKNVQNLKEKAVKEAEKRIKEYERMQEKAARKAKKEDKKFKKETEKMYEESAEVQTTLPRPSISIPKLGLHRDSQLIYDQPKFSDIVNSGTGGKKPPKGGVAQKIQKKKEINGTANGDFKIRQTDSLGNHSVRSITNGLRRGSEVMYVPKYETQNGSQNTGRQRADAIFANVENEPYLDQSSSLFARPGVGNLAFRPSLTDTLLSIPPEFSENHRHGKDGDDFSDPGSPGRISEADSIGSAGSLARMTGKHSNWYHGNNGEDSALETFLVAHDLLQCLPYLQNENIDLKALLLLTENDLKEVQMPLGLRKKMMEAIGRRKAALNDAGDVVDSRL